MKVVDGLWDGFQSFGIADDEGSQSWDLILDSLRFPASSNLHRQKCILPFGASLMQVTKGMFLGDNFHTAVYG